MRLLRRAHAEGTHPVRNTLLGLFFIFLVLILAPDLGSGHAKEVRDNHQANIGGLAEDNPSLSSPQEIITWTVLRHQGYNPNWQCWILQLNRIEGPQQETTSQFCAKDKADYDSHVDGSQYETKGGWLDNVLEDAPDAQPTDST